MLIASIQVTSDYTKLKILRLFNKAQAMNLTITDYPLIQNETR